MKNRRNLLIVKIITACLISFLLILMEFSIMEKVIEDEKARLIICAFIGIIFVAMYATYAFAEALKQTATELEEESKHLEKKLAEIEKYLSSEFKPVELIDLNNLNRKSLKSYAKMVDGKILCRINLEQYAEFESYEEFSNFFDIKRRE